MTRTFARYLADLAERTAATFVQAFAAALLLGAHYDLSAAQAAALAAVPAGIAVIKNAIGAFLLRRTADPTPRTGAAYLVDLAERTVATYAEAFAGALILHGTLSMSVLDSALYAAVPAALAVLKGGLARFVGDSATAAFLPAEKDPGGPLGSRPA
ncbi:hypothetical protein [Embleya sp. NPDC005971]|uniref:hypothetical protein n=1 Tax=Embleya sp. NPDC005971 TaxID=3156724 RepID=UPI0033CBCA4D